MNAIISLNNQSVDLKINIKEDYFKRNWRHTTNILMFFNIAQGSSFDSTATNIGSFFIKNINLLNWADCKPLNNEIYDKLHGIFTPPDQTETLPDIAYMYSIKNFKVLKSNETKTKATYIAPPPSLISMNKSFVSCFENISISMPEEMVDPISFTTKLLGNKETPLPCRCHQNTNLSKSWQILAKLANPGCKSCSKIRILVSIFARICQDLHFIGTPTMHK